MSREQVERRLAAILAADVAGSCRLMGIDEEGTLAQLRAFRKTLFDPKVTDHRGRIVKNTGDGALVEFASVVDAVRCADEIQRSVAEQNTDVPQDKRIEFRIGIHVGDIIIADDDIFGDGVNIAVRLEGIADPGGICISDDAHRQVRGKVESTLEDMGIQTLKNIAEPMRAWRVRPVGTPSPAFSDRAAAEPVAEAAEQPSIAVLPFQNMSEDPDQDHFTDGVVEDIITGLSHVQWLSVVARNSSFAYRGRAIDVRQVGRELGVRFILEGSVRKAGDRVRITGQLIDTTTGTHVWADRFDGGLEHAFDLQDQVTASVVGAIEPAVLRVETRRATRKPAATAWERLMQGFAIQRQFTREANAEALQIFLQAIQLDPDLPAAHAFASQSYTWAKSFGWFTDPAAESAEGARLARRALDLGRDDPAVLTAAGFGLAYLQGDLDTAADAIARARALNPNSAAALGPQGWIHIWRGEPELALADVERAMQLSPSDVFAFAWWCVGSYAHFACGRYDDALSWAERTLRERPGYLPAARMIVASAALGGRPESAEMSLARLRQLEPMLRLSNLGEQMPFRHAGDLARLTDGLRKAGLPE